MKTISQMIRETNGRFFRVSFTKRTNGETRNMTARTGVRKNLVGTGLKFEPKDHGLIGVYDVAKKNYRFVPEDAVTFFKSGKVTWRKS